MNSGNPSKKWPLRENVGHRGDIRKNVLSNLRSPDTKGEKREAK